MSPVGIPHVITVPVTVEVRPLGFIAHEGICTIGGCPSRVWVGEAVAIAVRATHSVLAGEARQPWAEVVQVVIVPVRVVIEVPHRVRGEVVEFVAETVSILIDASKPVQSRGPILLWAGVRVGPFGLSP